MEVYQLDNENLFAGAILADESPLEPGVFIIPGGCVTVPPPSFADGFKPKWQDGAWAVIELPKDEPEGPAPGDTEPTLDDYRMAIQARIDATAQERGYDSGLSCATYVASSNPTWANEAQAFIEWRDAVWIVAQSQLADVQSGKIEAPSVAEMIDALPGFAWLG